MMRNKRAFSPLVLLLAALLLCTSFVQLSGAGQAPAAASTGSKVRVRVEGPMKSMIDKTVTVSGSALDALKKAAGSSKVQLSNGMITGISGVQGKKGVAANTDTSWMYYVIRSGAINLNSLANGANSYKIKSGDQIVFYVGAYDSVTYDAKTYYPVVTVSPKSPKAGKTVTFKISAKKCDWSAGKLLALTAAEEQTLGYYSLKINGKVYKSKGGKVTVRLKAGTWSYTVTNHRVAGSYPDTVTYKSSIRVAK